MKLWKASWFLVILLGVLFGMNMVICRYILRFIPPITLTTVRFVLAALGYIGLYLLLRNRKFPKDIRIWKKGIIYSILATIIPTNAFIFALNHQSSGVVSLLQTVNPAITILMAHYFLADERLTWKKVLGVLVAFVGASVLVLSGETGLVEIDPAGWQGYIWAGVAIISVSISVIFARRYLKNSDTFELSSIQIITAGVGMIPLILISGGVHRLDIPLGGVLALIYISLVGTLLVFLLNFFLINRFGATVSSQVSYVIPISATALGVIFLGESFSFTLLISMTMILFGVSMITPPG